MSIIISIHCSRCGEKFPVNINEYRLLGFHALPKSCPRCKDEEQGRPDVTLQRRELFSVTCRIASLPPVEWVQVRAVAGDKPAWKGVVKGKMFGAAWVGRIDLYSVAPQPPRVGEVVNLVEMQVLKRVAKKWQHRVRSDFKLGHAVEYSVSRRVPLADAENEGAQVFEERWEYIRLDPADEADPQGRQLVWAKAHTKTTLKGFGRQYWATIEGNPIWQRTVTGGYRSGRASTTGCLAVVDGDHPLLIVHKEGGAEEITRIPPEGAL